MTFYIKSVFLYISVHPEDGFCRPKDVREISTT